MNTPEVELVPVLLDLLHPRYLYSADAEILVDASVAVPCVFPSHDRTVIHKVHESRLFNSAWQALEKLDLGWDQKTAVQNISKLTQNALTIGLKPEDMAEMVDELWGIKKAQKKIEQKKQENQEFLTGKKPVQQMASGKSAEALFFDEI